MFIWVSVQVQCTLMQPQTVSRGSVALDVQVRRELGLGQEERVVLLMYGGQPAGAWHLRAQARSGGRGRLPGTAHCADRSMWEGLCHCGHRAVCLLRHCRRAGGAWPAAAASRWALGRCLTTSCLQTPMHTHQIWYLAFASAAWPG